MTMDEKNIVARVDPVYPMVWQEGQVALFLTKMSEKVMVLIDTGRHHWLLRNHRAEEIRMSEPDDQGVEQFEAFVL